MQHDRRRRSTSSTGDEYLPTAAIHPDDTLDRAGTVDQHARVRFAIRVLFLPTTSLLERVRMRARFAKGFYAQESQACGGGGGGGERPTEPYGRGENLGTDVLACAGYRVVYWNYRRVLGRCVGDEPGGEGGREPECVFARAHTSSSISG